MAFEIKYTFHPRKDDGEYDTNLKEEKLIKIGKGFDDISLEKVATTIMSQLARRDIWVVGVEVFELVKKNINFKECKDGKGIILKGKKFSFSDSSSLICEDKIEQEEQIIEENTNKQINNNLENLYNPKNSAPVQSLSSNLNINKNKIIYKVIFDPPIQYINELKRLRLRLSPDNEYAVHQVIQHPTGKLELQKIAITDDVGNVIVVDEKFFTNVGTGLLADKQLNFSGETGLSRTKKPKLLYEDQLVYDVPNQQVASSSCRVNAPIDDGSIPPDLMAVPDIRSGR